MKYQFNPVRFLAFSLVSVALAGLTVYGPEIMPHYLVGPFVVFLFLTLFIAFYTSPRWKPTIPLERITIPKLLAVFAVVAIVVIAVTWFNLKFPQSAVWLDSLLILSSVFIGFFLLRRRAHE